MTEADWKSKPIESDMAIPLAARPAHSRTTIGYLVPEFPGQTHNFFNREIKALSSQGVNAEVVSTRPPPRANKSAALEAEFAERVTYIFPFRASDILGLVGMLAHIKVSGIGKALGIVFDDANRGFRTRIRLLLLAAVSAKLALMAKRAAWTHVHVHSCADAANVALFSNVLFGTTYSLTLHNPIHVYGGNQPAKFGHAAFAIFITPDICDEAAEVLGPFMPDRTSIAPMGLDATTFQRGTPYVPYTSERALRVFCCARLSHAKGQHVLIEAVSLLVAKGMSIDLVLAGEDDAAGAGYRVEVEQQIADLNLDGNVTLLGSISEDQVRAELEASHVFVLPSMSEPLGVAIMEAMAMELPVVSTNAGGVPLLVENGRDGLLVSPANAAELAAAIERIACDPPFAAELARQARKKAVGSFSAGRSATEIASSIQRRSG